MDAANPETYGGYYAWGELETKTTYTWGNYQHCDGTEETCHDIGSDIAYTQYDVAHEKWGGDWEMPSLSHYKELFENCTKEKISVEGIKGMLLTAPNGNSIYFAPGGFYFINGSVGIGSNCDYWLSTRNAYEESWAQYMWVDYTEDYYHYESICDGKLVRPILRPPHLTLSESSLTIALDTQKAVDITSINGGDTAESSDEAVATAVVEGTQIKVTANGVGQAVITVKDVRRGQTATIDVTVVRYYTCPDDNHPHVIDLGLSKKWACCNVGATKPEDYGDYYAWGELEPKTTYTWSNYKHCDGTEASCHDIGNSIPDKYDVAVAKWGEYWEIPSRNNLLELFDCPHESTTENGIKGFRFIGKNGNSIFIPMAGRYRETGLYKQGENGFYWSETKYENSSAYGLMFIHDENLLSEFGLSRDQGLSIRPVCWL